MHTMKMNMDHFAHIMPKVTVRYGDEILADHGETRDAFADWCEERSINPITEGDAHIYVDTRVLLRFLGYRGF